MNTPEKVGGLIRNAITAAKAKQWAIVRHHVRGPSNAKPCCCAIGSLVIDVPGGVPLYGEICSRLGIEHNEAIGIARGFDGKSYDGDISTPDWHALGERIYQELSENLL